MLRISKNSLPGHAAVSVNQVNERAVLYAVTIKPRVCLPITRIAEPPMGLPLKLQKNARNKIPIIINHFILCSFTSFSGRH